MAPSGPDRPGCCGPGWAGEQARAVGSDAEAFLPAINVTEPQVDIRADALQGLQPKGATEVLRVSPRRGQPEAKAGEEEG